MRAISSAIAERLGDVVVGAERQRQHLVALLILGRQHHDRRVGILGAQRADHVEAARAWAASDRARSGPACASATAQPLFAVVRARGGSPRAPGSSAGRARSTGRPRRSACVSATQTHRRRQVRCERSRPCPTSLCTVMRPRARARCGAPSPARARCPRRWAAPDRRRDRISRRSALLVLGNAGPVVGDGDHDLLFIAGDRAHLDFLLRAPVKRSAFCSTLSSASDIASGRRLRRSADRRRCSRCAAACPSSSPPSCTCDLSARSASTTSPTLTLHRRRRRACPPPCAPTRSRRSTIAVSRSVSLGEHLQALLDLLRIGEAPVLQRLDEHPDAGERRAQIVADTFCTNSACSRASDVPRRT